MKNAITFILATLILLALSACGGGNADNQTESDILLPTEAQAEQTMQDAETILLTGAIVIRDDWLYVDLVEILMHDEDGHILPFMSERALGGVNILTVDEVAEQGLDLEQFHSWHFIRHNVGSEPLRFEINEETMFTFTDSALEFHEENPEDNPRRQANVGMGDFIRYIENSFWVTPIPPVLDSANIGADTLTRIPYFVTVQNGKVIGVLEELLFTQ